MHIPRSQAWCCVVNVHLNQVCCGFTHTVKHTWTSTRKLTSKFPLAKAFWQGCSQMFPTGFWAPLLYRATFASHQVVPFYQGHLCFPPGQLHSVEGHPYVQPEQRHSMEGHPCFPLPCFHLRAPQKKVQVQITNRLYGAHDPKHVKAFESMGNPTPSQCFILEAVASHRGASQTPTV